MACYTAWLRYRLSTANGSARRLGAAAARHGNRGGTVQPRGTGAASWASALPLISEAPALPLPGAHHRALSRQRGSLPWRPGGASAGDAHGGRASHPELP